MAGPAGDSLGELSTEGGRHHIDVDQTNYILLLLSRAKVLFYIKFYCDFVTILEYVVKLLYDVRMLEW